MASKNIRIRPEGVGDYADVLHPETNTGMVVTSDGVSLEEKLDEINVELSVKLGRTESAFSSDKLTTPRTIDGIAFDGSANITSYAVCSSDSSNGVKEVTLVGAHGVAGLPIRVKFINDNVHTEPSLSINGEISGTIRTSNGSAFKDIKAGGVYTFVYDGSAFILQGESGVSGSGGSGDLNIFIQSSEPETKEGIWLKTDGVYDEIIEDYDLYFAGTMVEDSDAITGITSTVRVTNPLKSIRYGDEFLIYMDGTEMGTYNINTQVVKKLGTNSSLLITQGRVTSNETEIIAMYNAILRKATLESYFSGNPVWTSLYNGSSSNNYNLRPVYYEGDVYHFANYSYADGTYNPYFIKTNLATGVNTNLPADNLLFTTYRESILYGNKIYLFPLQFGNSLMQVSCYDIELGTWTHHSINIELTGYGSTYNYNYSILIGNKVYLPIIYKEITTTINKSVMFILNLDTMTLEHIPLTEGITNSSYFLLGSKIYFIGTPISVGTTSMPVLNKFSSVYSLDDKVLPENTLVLNERGAHHAKTELVSNSKLPYRNKTAVGDVYYYRNNAQEYMPVYFGDSATWHRLKN